MLHHTEPHDLATVDELQLMALLHRALDELGWK